MDACPAPATPACGERLRTRCAPCRCALPPAQVRNNDSLCRTPLLAHPLTAARIRGVHSVLRLSAAMLPGEPRAAEVGTPFG